MCNAANCSHDDLNDDLSDIFGGDLSADDIAFGAKVMVEQLPERFETKCRKCNGSGRFYGYSGRVVGNCFTCKGKGVFYTKTDPAVLAANREKAAERREQKARTVQDHAEMWIESHPAEWTWINEAATRGFEFAVSLKDALFRTGGLSEKQTNAATNAAAKSAARKAQWEADKIAREAAAPSVSIDRIAQAFSAAKASRLKWPKLRLDTFVFSLASETGRNAGAIYVKDADSDTYLGKIVGDKLTRSRDCDAATEARIIVACADPAAAATAYGKRTGQCSCCGRELTNEESIARAIGPVCAEKWNF